MFTPNQNSVTRQFTGFKTRMTLLLTPLLLLGTFGASQASAQHRGHDNFYNGARNGSRGGYYDHGHDRYNDNRRYDDRRNQGGIGPGKGALIGAGGGAVLGLLFGGGAKGALIGGGAGAGIGAIAGKVHQDHTRDRDRRYYPR